MFTVEERVFLDNSLKQAPRLLIIAVKLPQEALVVVDGELGRVVIAKPLLDVLSMIV